MKEETKSEKRIDETRKRAEEIRLLRKRNEEKVRLPARRPAEPRGGPPGGARFRVGMSFPK